MQNKNLEQQLRELAKKFSKQSGSDNDAFRLMKKILQDELGYQFIQSATKPITKYTKTTTKGDKMKDYSKQEQGTPIDWKQWDRWQTELKRDRYINNRNKKQTKARRK